MKQVTRSWQACLLMAVLGASAAQAQSVRETVRETVPQVQPALSADAPPPATAVNVRPVCDSRIRAPAALTISDACTTTTLAGHYSALLMMANWIYAMEILTGAECLRALENRDYLSLIPERPDLFAHQPHELERTIARLQTHLARTQE